MILLFFSLFVPLMLFIGGVIIDEQKLIMNEFLYQSEIKLHEQQTRSILTQIPTNILLLDGKEVVFANTESKALIESIRRIPAQNGQLLPVHSDPLKFFVNAP